jgi:hypothetical protein
MASDDVNLDLPDGENFAPSADKVKKMETLLGEQPFHIGFPCGNREEWDRWRDHQIGRYWIEKAAEMASGDLERITDALYAESYHKDDRSIFGSVYVVVMRRLIAMTFAECLDPTGKYLTKIEEEIGHFQDLSTWINPAHDKDVRNLKGETIEIDLSSVNSAMTIAAVDFLLGDRLQKETRNLIRSEIEKRIFEPFRQRIESGKDIFWWVTCTHNWNTVCLNGVLSCALYLKKDLSERAWYLAVVDDLIEYSNKGFEESGFYTEGMSYWVYGFGNYVAISELVRSATGGKIDWLKQPLQKRMALYGVRMELQDSLFPAFADSQMDYKPVTWITNWLNNRLDEDPERSRSTEEEINLFDDLDKQSITTFLLNMFHTVDGQKAHKLSYNFPYREWFEDVQFLICRPDKSSRKKLVASFMGGHNGVNHNHNDLGTFTVAVGNKFLLHDPGAEVYRERTFSKNRYQSDLLNSFGHPVPVVAGELQVPGKDEHMPGGYGSHAFTTILEKSFSDARDRLVLDLTQAYRVDSLISLSRAFVYDRMGEGSIEVTDEVVFSQPESFETALITYAEWSLNEDGSLSISDGEASVGITVSSEDGDLEFSHCVIEESSTPTRLSWQLKDPVEKAQIKINIRPL